MRNSLLAAVILLTSACTAEAAAVGRILLPIVLPAPVAGGFGSLWTTRLTILNIGQQSQFVGGLYAPCGFDPCILPAVGPQATMAVSPYMASNVPARFLVVDADHLADIKVELRVQDLSRQASTWGTEIPVIAETQAARQPVELLGIPLDSQFRVLLRVYDFDPAPEHFVIVRVFRPTDHPATTVDALVKEIALPLKVPKPLDDYTWNPAYPGYAQLSISDVAGLPTTGDLRIEVVPGTAGLRFWAFASITHNETQHVTIVTP